MIETVVIVVVLCAGGLIGLVLAGLVGLFRGSSGGPRVQQLEGEMVEVRHACGALTVEMGHARAAFGNLSARVTTIERYLQASTAHRGAARELPSPAAAFAPVNIHPAPSGTRDDLPGTAPPPLEITPVEPADAASGAAPSVPDAASAQVKAPSSPDAAAGRPETAPSAPDSTSSQPGGAPSPVDTASAGPEAAPSPPADAPPPAVDDVPAGSPIDWERWIGVRGAAALGAAVLVIAGIYFFKFAADRGVFTLPVRTVVGAAVGLLSVGASQSVLRERYKVLSGWLAGAGVAILYITTWAAGPVYNLIGTLPAVAGMVVITAGCVALSLRHASLPIAILGLFGGFFTPMALSSHLEHPLQLFGYLLVLDVGLLAVARRRGWWALAFLSFGLTLIYESFWIVRGMGGAIWPGFGLVALFAALFTFAGKPSGEKAPSEGMDPGRLSAVALLVPFAFALYLGLRSEPSVDLLPIAVMVLLPSAGAVVRSSVGGGAGIAVPASLASLAVLGGWVLRNAQSVSSTGVTAVVLLLAAVFHAGIEVERRRGKELSRELAGAALVAAMGGVFLLLGAGLLAPAVEPVYAGVAVLCAALFRQATFPGRESLHLAPALAVGVVLPALHVAHLDNPAFPGATAHLAGAVLAALVLLGASFLRSGETARRWAEHGAALAALLLLSEPVLSAFVHAPAAPVLGSTLALGAILLAVGILSVNRAWIIVAMVAVAAVQGAWTFTTVTPRSAAEVGPAALLGLAASTLVFALWPLVTQRRFRHDPAPYRTAAFAAPLFFPALAHAWTQVLEGVSVGVLPLLLAAVTLVPAAVSARSWETAPETRMAAIGRPAGVAVAFVSLAIPISFENDGITVGYALLGLALVALFRRFDHLGLKYAGLAHLFVATARAVADERMLSAPAAGEMVFFNVRLLTHGVSALCLIGAFLALRDVEVPRLRVWEQGLQGRDRRAASMGMLLSAVTVVFVWLNVEVWRAFSDGPAAQVLEHMPARDLTLSAAWVVYALALLGLGMRLGSTVLRWMSLLLLLATSGKVFLYDLGQLRDLYRVASLVGLAVSLILVSLVYQRFVLGGKRPRAPR